MEDVHYEVADLEKAKTEHNGLSDKIVEKWGAGHSIEFTIKDDILTLRTTKKTFTAPIYVITITTTGDGIFYLKAKNGDKININRLLTYLDVDDYKKVEHILEKLPGYKGEIKWVKKLSTCIKALEIIPIALIVLLYLCRIIMKLI